MKPNCIYYSGLYKFELFTEQLLIFRTLHVTISDSVKQRTQSSDPSSKLFQNKSSNSAKYKAIQQLDKHCDFTLKTNELVKPLLDDQRMEKKTVQLGPQTEGTTAVPPLTEETGDQLSVAKFINNEPIVQIAPNV